MVAVGSFECERVGAFRRGLVHVDELVGDACVERAVQLLDRVLGNVVPLRR